MTRYFYDTEFLEDGRTIDLISIGIVADDGREFYAINEAIGRGKLYEKIVRSKFLMTEVVPNLPTAPGRRVVPPSSGYAGRGGGFFQLDEWDARIMPLRMIRNGVRDFLAAGTGDIELWADYSAYDHVAYAQLFGTMMDLPEGFPMFTNDLQQAWRTCGQPELPVQEEGVHNALEDARHVRACFNRLDLMEWDSGQAAALAWLGGDSSRARLWLASADDGDILQILGRLTSLRELAEGERRTRQESRL